MKDRLISEYRFIEDLYGCLDECDFELKDVVDVLKGVESVDAVQVVLCKDCNLSMPAYTNGKMSETEIYCPFLDIRKPNDWHCGDGLRKRKDGDKNES